MSLVRTNRFMRPGFYYNPAAVARAGSQVGQELAKYIKRRWNEPSSSGTGSSSRSTSYATPSGITTDHHDATLVYRRRRQPYKKRKRWIKFTRKVKRVMESDASPKYQVILSDYTGTSSANKQLLITQSTLLGSYGYSNISDDIKQLFSRDVGVERFHVTGALMETMVANTGASTAYVDCYYWRCKKSVPVGAATDVGNLWTKGLLDLETRAPSGGSSLDVYDYGVTPFQSNAFTRFINVYKKVRIKLGAGETTQLKIGRKLSRFINVDSASQFTALKGLTEGILFVAYGTPSSTNTVCNPVTIQVSINKNLTYRVLDTTVPTGGTTQA